MMSKTEPTHSLKIILILTYFIPIFTFGDYSDENKRIIFPWTARIIAETESVWQQVDVMNEQTMAAVKLAQDIPDLKFKNKLSCNNYSASLQISFPSLGKTIKVDQRMTTNNNVGIDLSVFENGAPKEVARVAFKVRTKIGQMGQIRSASLLEINTDLSAQQQAQTYEQRSLSVGWINKNYLERLHKILSGTTSSIEINSPFFRDNLRALNKIDQGFACCRNQSCRQYLEGLKPTPPTGEVRKASLENGI